MVIAYSINYSNFTQYFFNNNDNKTFRSLVGAAFINKVQENKARIDNLCRATSVEENTGTNNLEMNSDQSGHEVTNDPSGSPPLASGSGSVPSPLSCTGAIDAVAMSAETFLDVDAPTSPFNHGEIAPSPGTPSQSSLMCQWHMVLYSCPKDK